MLQPGMECEDGEILNEDDDEWDVGEVCEEAYEDMENLWQVRVHALLQFVMTDPNHGSVCN